MLQSFRRARSSWIVLGLLGLVMIAFIVTGFGTGGGGIGDLANSPDRLATAGSEVVTEQDLVNRLNQQLKSAQRDHPSMDMAQFIKLGAFEDALELEILNRAQIAFAAKHGIAASKRMVDGEIAAVPNFQNAAGAFDEAGFRTALAQAGIAEADLRRDVMLDVLRDQMLGPITQGPRLPGNVLTFYANLLLEIRTGAVAVVPSKAVGPGGDPTPTEIAAYFKTQPGEISDPGTSRAALRDVRLVRCRDHGPGDRRRNRGGLQAERRDLWPQGDPYGRPAHPARPGGRQRLHRQGQGGHELRRRRGAGRICRR